MRKPAIHPDDFPIEANETTVTTNKGKPLANAESEPVADEIADRLNEQADREEHDKWSP
ncbi:hypothetical protein LPJ38_16595 [Bradyrhizobium daqingense]|uniref:Uncharacterized protein n=1 Tax=Bradyrhizobium daqingense TaxID=993502 RepID=A0A562LV58_9BRAD|nr:hypothetical protein [Bradyrhizobium daqingense]TWI11443.1 hypothetical protein IQ17_00594 [Bradyrhizobium daqingense]UFS92268.1 hypothetical protein LPJ38_16595 [Bradyrhizobium daqingense]